MPHTTSDRLASLLGLLFIFLGLAPLAAQTPDPLPNRIEPTTPSVTRAQTGRINTTATLMLDNVSRRMELYRQAGVTSDKLTRLEGLHRDLFRARFNSETTRTLELRRRITDTLSAEEQRTVEALSRAADQQLRESLALQRTNQSTAPLSAIQATPTGTP